MDMQQVVEASEQLGEITFHHQAEVFIHPQIDFSQGLRHHGVQKGMAQLPHAIQGGGGFVQQLAHRPIHIAQTRRGVFRLFIYSL